MKTPVTLVTGFLGAGKTTLINNLLGQVRDKRLAVIVNEFGDVSVDGSLLAQACEEGGTPLFEISSGCICCTVEELFVPRMKQIAAEKNKVDHILVETSGLALPLPVIMALGWRDLRNDYYLDALITVVDAPLVLEGSFAEAEASTSAAHQSSTGGIFRQQLEHADVVVLNKIDDLAEPDLIRAEELVREYCPKVRFLELAWGGELDPRLSMGLNLHGTPHGHGGHGHHHHHHGPVHSAPMPMDAPPADQSTFDGHQHGQLDSHEHSDETHQHFHAHDTGWQSFTLHTHQPQDAAKIKEAVKEVCSTEPILRAKGRVSVAGKDFPLVVQAVRTRVNAYFARVSSGSGDSSLVFIGYHPQRGQAAAILSRITGTHWH